MRRHSRAVALAVSVIAFAAYAGSAVAAITSPQEACQFYKSRWEQGLLKVIDERAERCLVQVGDPNAGIGYIEAYYDGGRFCLKSYGAYFNNAGVRDSVECTAASGAGSANDADNPFAQLLHDPNLKWYAAAAVAIAAVSLLSGRLIDRRKKR